MTTSQIRSYREYLILTYIVPTYVVFWGSHILKFVGNTNSLTYLFIRFVDKLVVDFWATLPMSEIIAIATLLLITDVQKNT